ncbi:MAG TPA: NAD-dependent epimerase/dehydratase family protein [Polyangiaceae bacterium]|nr:NAD-dependent epimerase/dehydratase family protein [Polyangiaceae bacterium]
MPTALVTGAAGVMGARLVSRLRAAGWNVRALVLPKDPLRARIEHLGCELREGDVRDAVSLEGACDGVDTVYHLAAVIIAHDPSQFTRVNRDGTAHVVAEARRAGVGHFVYVSSASVVYPRRTAYAESKLQAEELVQSSGLPFTIVRPTLVYERGGGQELMMFLDYLRRFPVVPFIGAGAAVKRPVWSEDIVDGLLRLAGARVALGKTYNFSGAERISMLALARLLLAHHDRSRPFLHLPVWLCRLLAGVLGLLMTRPPLTLSAIAGVVNDADLDPALAMRELGYAPLGVRDGFERCFRAAAAEPALELAFSSNHCVKGNEL